MMWRSLVLLMAAVGVSVAATLYFGNEVLIALGLILVQIKVIAKKLMSLEVPAVLYWLKMQGQAFLKVELLKKWASTTLAPLLLGRAVLRRIAAYLGRYKVAVTQRYAALLQWYIQLPRAERAIATLIILFATLALSVTSLGLWLILFSVKLPLWVAAAVTALWRSVWTSTQKMAFRALAFLQLGWLWRGVKRIVPASWLDRKRRAEFRLARAVVRRRRLTLRQLADRKDRLSFRIGILWDLIWPARRNR